MSNILSIGKSALNAAQIGIATTGHNIANAATPGFNRQVVVQAAAQSQDFGFGFLGQGTDISSVVRTYNETIAKQVLNTTTSSNASKVYLDQISQINNLLSDADAGLGPVMTDFFKTVNAVASNPSDIATRQTMMSSAQSLVNRFTAVNNRMNELRDGVNTQISANIGEINTYATQIANLNEVIDKALSSTGNPPNDLMDQRDLLVKELSKSIKTTVIQQNQGTYNVFVGNGLPLVVGADTYQLYPLTSNTDPNRLEVAYGDPDDPNILNSDTLPGGTLGGLLKFRGESLDVAQNQIGQLAITLATSFNTQHKLGYDLNGVAGEDLFSIPDPVTTASVNNTGSLTVGATITTPSDLTSSNYRVQYLSGEYVVTRLADKKEMYRGATPPASPIDGLTLNIAGAAAEHDDFVIRPTQYAANNFKLAFSDVNKLAMAGSNTTGPSDNTNGLALAKLQTGNNVTLIGSNQKRTYAQAFAFMVSGIGTKTKEVEITQKADSTALELAENAMQSESGVNLDEEATNLIRYQQAYQAAGKMMQIASQLFDVLLQLGQ